MPKPTEDPAEDSFLGPIEQQQVEAKPLSFAKGHPGSEEKAGTDWKNLTIIMMLALLIIMLPVLFKQLRSRLQAKQERKTPQRKLSGMQFGRASSPSNSSDKQKAASKGFGLQLIEAIFSSKDTREQTKDFKEEKRPSIQIQKDVIVSKRSSALQKLEDNLFKPEYEEEVINAMSSKQFLKLVQSFDEDVEEEQLQENQKDRKRGPKSVKAPSHKARSEFRKKKYQGAKSEKAGGKIRKKAAGTEAKSDKKKKLPSVSLDQSSVQQEVKPERYAVFNRQAEPRGIRLELSEVQMNMKEIEEESVNSS